MERQNIFTAAHGRRQTARRRRIDSANGCACPNPATIGWFPPPESNASKSESLGDFLNGVNAPAPATARIAKFSERAFINNSSWICHEAPA
jgi:hypothetical protein